MKWYSKEVVFSTFSFLTLAIAAFGFFFGPAQIPIWYSLSVSEQHIDQKAFLFVFPLCVIAIAISHTFLIRVTKQIDQTMSRIILWASVIPLCILSIALIHILVITL